MPAETEWARLVARGALFDAATTLYRACRTDARVAAVGVRALFSMVPSRWETQKILFMK